MKKTKILIDVLLLIVTILLTSIDKTGRQEEIKPEESIDMDNEEDTNVANTENTANNSEEATNTSKSGNKILVVYYSAQSHTKAVAEKIAKNLNADTFEIVPEEVYSDDDLNWANSNSRVSREHNDESLRDVK